LNDHKFRLYIKEKPMNDIKKYKETSALTSDSLFWNVLQTKVLPTIFFKKYLLRRSVDGWTWKGGQKDS